MSAIPEPDKMATLINPIKKFNSMNPKDNFHKVVRLLEKKGDKWVCKIFGTQIKIEVLETDFIINE